MTDDIVTRLRGQACPECGLPSTHNQFDEAADEIEMLRKIIHSQSVSIQRVESDKRHWMKIADDLAFHGGFVNQHLEAFYNYQEAKRND